MSEFGKVAVLMGGLSAEREVSLKSGAAVLAALQERGVDAHGIDAGRDVLDRLRDGGFARAFNVLHGTWGEDGVIPAALELIGMPCTGSGVMASALAMDKLRSRYLLMGAGLPTPDFMVLHEMIDFDTVVERLGLSLAVKPNSQGSSLGVSKVTAAGEWPVAWQRASELDDTVLVERWIEGRELHAAVLQGQALPLVRVEAPGGIYDYEAKYLSDRTEYHCPAGLDDALEQRLRTLALESFHALGCRGWGRVDLLLDADNRPYVLEVNTVPGMTDHSLVPMAAQAAGIGFGELVWRILAQTLEVDD